MVFSSIPFLLYFLPVFLLVLTLVPKTWKNGVILAFSLLFYAWGAPSFLFILVASTIADFFIVRQLHRAKEKSHRKAFLLCSLGLNLGLLAYFKYANFFIENVNASLSLLGISSVSWTEVALPIGISFYTFQTLTYSIDVYRKAHEPLEKVSDYLLYIMSFPQMIAGPIVRYQEVADQISERTSTTEDKLLGFYRFTIGLAKKVFIANVLGKQADLIFGTDPTLLDLPTAWLGAVAYAGQIYFDFAGYSDMAIGLGRMMGFRFPENFESPYISTSITEFWRRWHITLGRWMRDYLYIPLGGSRVSSKWRLYFNLWLVFLLSGLWHGASWNFVIWGAFHGCFLILDRLFLNRLLSSIGRWPAVIITCFLVIIGWIFFRLETFSEAMGYLGAMFSLDVTGWPQATGKFWLTLAISLLASWGALTVWGNTVQMYLYPKKLFSVKEAALRLTLSLLIFAVSCAVITSQGFNPFIYFRF